MNYAREILDDGLDDGTMSKNVAALAQAVVGRRIAKVEKDVEVPDRRYGTTTGTRITLDDGTRVRLVERGDCCAFTELESFLLHPECVNHAITGVGTTDGYTRWHIYADMGDVLELKIEWSAGNVGYYAYGFDIAVEPSS